MRSFPHASARNNCSQGFTLIELMVVIVVVAILAAIAMPSYSEAVAKSRRSDAKALLTKVQAELERCFTVNISYEHTTTMPCPSAQGITGSNPISSEGGFYSVSDNGSLTATSYTLTAVRTGAQSNDRCGDFTLNSADVKSIVNQKTGVVAKDCW